MRTLHAAAILAFVPMTALSQAVSGTIRLWGDSDMQSVSYKWQQGFQKRYPGIAFETKLLGTGTGMAGLYTGVADIAFMGRPATAKEIIAFEWVHKYKPLALEILTGSDGTLGRSSAITVYVHRDNPITRLSVAQLEAILGCEPALVHHSARTWGDLGVSGAWADRPIHIYMPDTESGTGSFLRQMILRDSRKWNWQNIREFSDETGRQILDALATDSNGIALASVNAAPAGVKPLALAGQGDANYFHATPENLIAGRYPLTRFVFAYINRAPDKSVDMKVKEFLRYIFGPEGQGAADGDFLPLNPDTVREPVKKLE